MYVNWGGGRVNLTWQNNKQLPQMNLVTSAHGLCFHDGKLLLVKLKARGWDFPGGHIEMEETPEESFKREALEEGYVEGNCEMLGYITVDHNENQLWHENSPYPRIGFQVFYKMNITNIRPFEAGYESLERIFINPNDVSIYYENWHELYQEILDCAINLSRKS